MSDIGPPPYLGMEAIGKRFGGTTALDDVSVSGRLGEVLAIVGENGAGKSTLVNVLSGAIRPDRGRILLDGEPVVLTTPQHANRLGIRAVHQEFSLVAHLSVAENILMGRLPTRGRGILDWRRTWDAAQELLSRLGFPDLDVHRRVATLSVSLQQVVEIAKALAQRPRILILDEPSAVLSKEELSLLFDIIRGLRESSTLVLYISHRLEEVFEIADRILVLRDGRVAGSARTADITQRVLVGMMVGREVEEIYPHRRARPGADVLSVDGLCSGARFRDVTFRVRRGEIVGVFGLVGSGTSEMARALFGAAPTSSGRILLDGVPVHFHSPRDAVASGVSLVTEDRKRDGLVMHCSVRDNVSLATMDSMSHALVIDRSLQRHLVREKVEELSIKTDDIERPARNLSGGNQQKVVLAKWLLSSPRVLILDEPTRGVDIGAKVEIYHLINGLVESGLAVLLISSEIPEVLGMSDRVLVMREGRIVREFDCSNIDEETILLWAAGVPQEE